MVGRESSGSHRNQPMTAQRNSSDRYMVLAISLGLAAVFFYAGIDKLRDPLEFADSIAAFAILPATLISPLALGLPIFEVVCGVLV